MIPDETKIPPREIVVVAGHDSDPDLQEVGEEIAGTLEDMADLARRAGRVSSKLSRFGKMLSSVVGPLDRPLADAPEPKRSRP